MSTKDELRNMLNILKTIKTKEPVNENNEMRIKSLEGNIERLEKQKEQIDKNIERYRMELEKLKPSDTQEESKTVTGLPAIRKDEEDYPIRKDNTAIATGLSESTKRAIQYGGFKPEDREPSMIPEINSPESKYKFKNVSAFKHKV